MMQTHLHNQGQIFQFGNLHEEDYKHVCVQELDPQILVHFRRQTIRSSNKPPLPDLHLRFRTIKTHLLDRPVLDLPVCRDFCLTSLAIKFHQSCQQCPSCL